MGGLVAVMGPCFTESQNMGFYQETVRAGPDWIEFDVNEAMSAEFAVGPALVEGLPCTGTCATPYFGVGALSFELGMTS